VLLGRFVGILRALVPAVAGDSRMPYSTFIVWNVVGALIWGPSVVVGGYVAGRSWRVIETYLSRGGLILLGLIVVICCVLYLVRKRREEREARDPYGT
jgi:membrane-associated protein